MAHSLFLRTASGANQIKKLIAAVAESVLGDGAPPPELLEVNLCDRFGWTFDELDTQDMTRVLPAVGAANTRDALQRILSAMDSGWKMKPSKEDWLIYDQAITLREEWKKQNS